MDCGFFVIGLLSVIKQVCRESLYGHGNAFTSEMNYAPIGPHTSEGWCVSMCKWPAIVHVVTVDLLLVTYLSGTVTVI